jgi:hypothetical protein
MSASRQEKSHDATDKADSRQSDERLPFNGGGGGRRRSTYLVSDLTINMFRGLGCLARQSIHLGPGITGKGIDGSLYFARHARGLVFDVVLIH